MSKTSARKTKAGTIRKEDRDAIVTQALKEIEFARTYKEGKLAGWRINEDMYYGKKRKTDDSRTNIELGQMQSFVHTLLSKIDSPLEFKFEKRKNSQLKRVAQLNALRTFDSKRDYWPMKDLVGKKQAIIYGRAIYFYFADSEVVYRPHLENVDVYDFLIDPSVGGIDVEQANYLGRYGVTKSLEQLKEGAKSGKYLKLEVANLTQNESGNMTEEIQEDINKRNRDYGSGATTKDKEVGKDGQYKFWEWMTTYKSQRYYLLLSPQGKCAIRVEELENVYSTDMWPVWTWAAFPDLTEFWTPSYCDYVREVFMGQSAAINQLYDNNERINKPQRLINVTAIENLADLKYRKDGYIRVKGDVDVNKAYQTVQVPSIDTPLKVYELLETIHEKSSGVNAGAKGDSSDTLATIYEGNQANTADRFGLLNRSYSFGYERFAALYEAGVREHLTKKVAIEILGPNGVEIKELDKEDIFISKDDKFNVKVESSSAELAQSIVDKKMKMNFYQSISQSQDINQKKLLELQAHLLEIDADTIKELLDVDEFGNKELMSEADRDIERILEGEQIKPNADANTAYSQRILDYIKDNSEDIDDEQFKALTQYLKDVQPIVMENMAMKLRQEQMKMAQQMPREGGFTQGKPKEIISATNEERTLNNLNSF
jgi:hypothetical protein